MSYTNEDLVRRFLAESRALTGPVTDQPLALGESETVVFSSGPINADSVRVKSVPGGPPIRRAVTLADGSAALGSWPTVPGSVVVASDSSLGHIYEENTDYIVDYAAARLTVKDAGALADDASVTVWLGEYRRYSAGVDYTLDAVSAGIRRLAGGGIAPGESLRLDYTPLYNAHDNLLVSAAVDEANGLIAAEIDPDREFGADPVLQSAATSAALASIGRAAAARALTSNPGDDRAAATWIKIAELYAARSESLLRRFRPPHRGPAAPATT